VRTGQFAPRLIRWTTALSELPLPFFNPHFGSICFPNIVAQRFSRWEMPITAKHCQLTQSDADI